MIPNSLRVARPQARFDLHFWWPVSHISDQSPFSLFTWIRSNIFIFLVNSVFSCIFYPILVFNVQVSQFFGGKHVPTLGLLTNMLPVARQTGQARDLQSNLSSMATSQKFRGFAMARLFRLDLYHRYDDTCWDNMIQSIAIWHTDIQADRRSVVTLLDRDGRRFRLFLSDELSAWDWLTPSPHPFCKLKHAIFWSVAMGSYERHRFSWLRISATRSEAERGQHFVEVWWVNLGRSHILYWN